jgi:hypothetical protein
MCGYRKIFSKVYKSLFNISACADWRDRFFVLQGKKPQESISCNDPIEGSLHDMDSCVKPASSGGKISHPWSFFHFSNSA